MLTNISLIHVISQAEKQRGLIYNSDTFLQIREEEILIVAVMNDENVCLCPFLLSDLCAHRDNFMLFDSGCLVTLRTSISHTCNIAIQ